MTRDELMFFCRYYKGEDDFPKTLENKSPMAFLFWEAEKMYVERTDTSFESEAVQQYLDAGLAGANLDLPLFLSACLFALFRKGSDHDLLTTAAYYMKNCLPAYLGSTVI